MMAVHETELYFLCEYILFLYINNTFLPNCNGSWREIIEMADNESLCLGGRGNIKCEHAVHGW